MTDKTSIKAIRLDNEIIEWLKNKDARRIIETVYDLWKAGKVQVDRRGVKITTLEVSDGLIQSLENIKQMSKTYQGSLDATIDSFEFALTWGTLKLKRGGVLNIREKTMRDDVVELWESYEDACKEKGFDSMDMFKRYVRGIWGVRR